MDRNDRKIFMNQLDFDKARAAFEEYVDQFDREDDKVKLKIIHTYGVVACAEAIAGRTGLSSEDIDIARVTALLHDIGRFEQIRLYDSFRPNTMDHAAFGAELLFGRTGSVENAGNCRNDGNTGIIRRFIETSRYDEIIRIAILFHSGLALPDIEDERILLHAQLIRDADKLDNCRVKIVESMDTLLSLTEEEVGKTTITPKVWDYCLHRQSVRSEDRVTPADYWVSYIAQYYDTYFQATRDIILEENYLSKMAFRVPWKDAETRSQFSYLVEQLNKEFAEKHKR